MSLALLTEKSFSDFPLFGLFRVFLDFDVRTKQRPSESRQKPLKQGTFQAQAIVHDPI
jgi:hypothetical protein